jgi:hypothetical protein
VNRDTTKDGTMDGVKMDITIDWDLWHKHPHSS